jgi:hypothetical protein
VTSSRVILYVLLGLAGLLSIDGARAGEPCAGHAAAASSAVAFEADPARHAELGTTAPEHDEHPCPHRDPRPCKSTCGACVATVATYFLPAPTLQPPTWQPARAGPPPPAIALTRLDRPPRR